MWFILAVVAITALLSIDLSVGQASFVTSLRAGLSALVARVKGYFKSTP